MPPIPGWDDSDRAFEQHQHDRDAADEIDRWRQDRADRLAEHGPLEAWPGVPVRSLNELQADALDAADHENRARREAA